MKETLSVIALQCHLSQRARPRAKAFAAGCVVLTTLLSIVTLPLCALVLTALM